MFHLFCFFSINGRSHRYCSIGTLIRIVSFSPSQMGSCRETIVYTYENSFLPKTVLIMFKHIFKYLSLKYGCKSLLKNFFTNDTIASTESNAVFTVAYL